VTARPQLLEHGRLLADRASWNRSVGADNPRFGLMLHDKAAGLLAAAERLAAHPSTTADPDLAARLAELRAAAARPVTATTFVRDVIEAAHAVAEQVEDTLGLTWSATPHEIEMPPRDAPHDARG
jgi:hypothetical protein